MGRQYRVRIKKPTNSKKSSSAAYLSSYSLVEAVLPPMMHCT